MIKAKRFGHVTLETSDLERQIAYFTEVAGLVLAERENGRAYLATKLGDLVVQLESGEHARCCQDWRSRWRPRATSTTSAAASRRKDCAVSHGNNPGPRALRKCCHSRDPKGTVCEVFAAQTPICKPQAVAGVGPLKLGHVAFVVPEPKEDGDFYGGVLGFRVSDWMEDWFVFMRCGPDHHTVNFVRGKPTQMHHVAFELRMAASEAACEFLAPKIPIIWGPGRHGPGHNMDTYHQNPEDQIVEMFTELDNMSTKPSVILSRGRGIAIIRRCPKVWGPLPTDIWGPPPTADYVRQRE